MSLYHALLLMILAACGRATIVLAEPLTVSDAIQTARFMAGAPTFATLTPSGEFLNSGASEIFLSPNKKFWAAMLIRGDLERNGNWAEVLVGGLESLDAAAPRVVARFFTHSLSDGTVHVGGAVALTLSGSNPQPLVWLADGRRLALLWADDSDRNQIFVVDVTTGKIQQLSNHPTSIRAFANHGDKFLYIANYREKESSALSERATRDRAEGVAIETRNLRAVLRGEFEEAGEGRDDYKWFILDADTGASKDVAGLGVSRFDWVGATFSPEGNFAIVESTPNSVPESWDRYTAPYWETLIARARIDRNDAMARQLMQLYVVDIRQRTAWPLWSAPGKAGAKIAWSSDERAVAVSPAFLPMAEANTSGLTGYATAVIEVKSGRFHALPIPVDSSLAAASLRWVGFRAIEARDGNERYEFHEVNGKWRRVSPRRRESGISDLGQVVVDVRVEEDADMPPVVVATERPSGRRRVVHDPNPELKGRFTLGRIEMIDWHDAEGRVWAGRLYYPVNWQAGHRYPLVIQTMPFAPKHKFSLYGGEPGLGPGVTMSAAQPLANREIMVLCAERKFLPEIDGTPEDAPVHVAAYEAAIDHLDRRGLIDRQRVGISGYSNTGYLVQFALVHSGFHYAAAITDDNFDGSYYQAVTSGLKEYAAEVGAKPYGDGLKLWIQRAPAFNADKIRTPLRLQVTSPPPVSILGSWEMFTRLRELNKPVEFFLIPEIQRGSHVIQNPAQCLASQEGAVDWFNFWLNGREDPDLEKTQQYVRWRKLRALNTSFADNARGYSPVD